MSGSTSNLRGVFFTSASTGIVVGENGTLLRTTDGGGTWTSQSGTSAHLQAVYFADSNTGTAVGGAGGGGGVILQTTNGGISWTSQPYGSTTPLLGVSFVSPTVGTVVGDNGIIFRTNTGGITGVEQDLSGEANRPSGFWLGQNYPNPFNPSTTIQFAIPEPTHGELKVFTSSGREVGALVSETLTAGTYKTQWDATGFPSGVYFCRMRAGTFMDTRKILLVK